MTMRSKFGILLLCLVTTSFALAEETSFRPASMEETDKFVSEVNQKRRSFAKEHNIANMHELIWSQKLADQLSDGTTKKGWFEKAVEKDFVYSSGFDDFLSQIDNSVGDIRKHLEKGSEDDYSGFDNYFLQPVHREIGCVLDDRKSYHICCLEPSAFVDSNDENNWLPEILKVKGTPGSVCHQGYGNKDGLCSLLPPTTAAPPTPKPQSVDVPDSDESSSYPPLFTLYSILLCSFLVQTWTLF